MRNFKRLEVWEEAHRLTLDVYKVTQAFPKEEMFWVDQSDAASVGFDSRRTSRKDAADDPTARWADFVQIAHGSGS